jgi:hypothetical protein
MDEKFRKEMEIIKKSRNVTNENLNKSNNKPLCTALSADKIKQNKELSEMEDKI